MRSGGTISRYVPRKAYSPPSDWRSTKRQAPPGRKSISQPGSVEPRRPHHCFTCSGLVCAEKRRRGGASKTRVMTISRSDSSVRVIAELCVAAMFLLLPLKVVEVGVEAVEAFLPVAPLALHPLVHLL